MWAPDDFPGADNVPWQLLIRARFEHEIDAVVSHVVVASLGPLLAVKKAHHLAGAASKFNAAIGDKQNQVELSAEQRINALNAFADWDGEICPRWWPRPPFPPRRRWTEDFDDPIVGIALDVSARLVGAAGSAQLGGELGAVLSEMGAASPR